ARLCRAGADAQRGPVESIVPLQPLRIVEGAERGRDAALRESPLQGLQEFFQGGVLGVEQPGLTVRLRVRHQLLVGKIAVYVDAMDSLEPRYFRQPEPELDDLVA